MLKNYLKVALRNLLKNKLYSGINIGGLAAAMAVAMLIGLWIYDELSFDTYHENYARIAQVMQHNMYNEKKETQANNPYLMAEEIRNNFGSDFKYVLQSSPTLPHTLAYGDKVFKHTGNFFEAEAPEMLSLKMLYGTREGLKEPYSVLLSESVAKAYFGNANPIDKIMKLGNRQEVKVTGVYEDLPDNTSFKDVRIILPWELFLINNSWLKDMENPWGANFSQTFAQIADKADMEQVSAKIKDVKLHKVSAEDKKFKPEVFLHPMSRWHLYSEFKNGIHVGGRVQYVRLFGMIGVFVLMLACINFMNLSTARSEKRAKEVGIRKVIGSAKRQLVWQFLSESVLTAFFAFILSLLLVELALSYFNDLAGKKINIPWSNPLFWFWCMAFSLFTGLIAGSYPALYLSAFQPIKVLKGIFKASPYASLPRKVLVVIQFTVSITLIIGTIIVFEQIQFAKNRPVGYTREGLIHVPMNEKIYQHFEAVRNELKSSRAILEMTHSTNPTTDIWSTHGDFDWKGKDPNLAVDFPNSGVTYEFGKTVGWQFVEGRDFSREFATDSAAMIINETAQKFMDFKNAVGETIWWDKKPYKIIGVVKDMIVQSPYEPIRPSLFHIPKERQENLLILKINPNLRIQEAMRKIETVFKKHSPEVPFEYQFVEEEYARKFEDEKRIGQLSSFFTILAILISCLGLFGLASFMAEKRQKEIGIRKVLGASVFNLWKLLSTDFVLLVFISCLFSMPIAYYFLSNWLKNYTYHTDISWWIFALAGGGALGITLLTVSYQAIKAATLNPVDVLKNE